MAAEEVGDPPLRFLVPPFSLQEALQTPGDWSLLGHLQPSCGFWVPQDPQIPCHGSQDPFPKLPGDWVSLKKPERGWRGFLDMGRSQLEGQ